MAVGSTPFYKESWPRRTVFDFTPERWCLPLGSQWNNGMVEKWNIGYEKRSAAGGLISDHRHLYKKRSHSARLNLFTDMVIEPACFHRQPDALYWLKYGTSLRKSLDFFSIKNNIAVVMFVISSDCYRWYFLLLANLANGTYLWQPL